jgi:hypothetical protein
MENFILPPYYYKIDDDGNPMPDGGERRRRVKEFALKKVAEAFQNYKQYVVKTKTPVFKGALEKLRAQWPEFVAYKESEKAKKCKKKKEKC